MDDRIFPKIWKLMHFLSINKPGKPKTLPSSYRPVALTSHLRKLLKSVIKEQLQDFIETHGLLSQNQHGFRKNKSTNKAEGLEVNKITIKGYEYLR